MSDLFLLYGWAKQHELMVQGMEYSSNIGGFEVAVVILVDAWCINRDGVHCTIPHESFGNEKIVLSFKQLQLLSDEPRSQRLWRDMSIHLETSTPMYSAFGPSSFARFSHCTRNRSVTLSRILPLRLNLLTLAQLSTYIVLIFPCVPGKYRNLSNNDANITITPVPGPFEMTKSGYPSFTSELLDVDIRMRMQDNKQDNEVNGVVHML